MMPAGASRFRYKMAMAAAVGGLRRQNLPTYSIHVHMHPWVALSPSRTATHLFERKLLGTGVGHVLALLFIVITVNSENGTPSHANLRPLFVSAVASRSINLASTLPRGRWKSSGGVRGHASCWACSGLTGGTRSPAPWRPGALPACEGCRTAGASRASPSVPPLSLIHI